MAPDYNAMVEHTLSEWGVHYKTVFIDRTGTNLFRDFCAVRSLYKAIKRIQPDVVLSYTIKPVIYGSIAAGWYGVKSINSMVTGLGWGFNKELNLKGRLIRNIIIRMYRYAAKQNSAVIFQNPDDQQVFIDEGIVTASKTYRIYGSGADIDHYTYSPPPKGPIRFLFIGRLIREKGLLDFIEACKRLKQSYPEIECDVLGGFDTNPGAVSKDLLNRLNSENVINLPGRVDDVRPYIRRASVFVLPSYYGEGTPRTALESMAMGRPLIMADSPGCRETVAEGENGFLVPVKDPVALAGAMEKFIKNPGLIVPMGKRSREIAEEKYDVRKVNRDIIRILGV